MKILLAQISVLIAGLFIFSTFSSFRPQQQKLFSLIVEVNHLRNNEGVVLFALYNRDDAFPDEHYEKK